ncbi:MAG: hypothetical protein ACHQF0_03955 [Chitinophagales bacterium]
MNHKEKLEELHKEASKKFDEYVKAKGELGKEHEEKVHNAKTDWQNAWSKLMEVLMVLENLEI